MKKSLVWIMVVCVFGLGACGTSKESSTAAGNPAGEFCAQVGGERVLKKDANGKEYGVCRLSNGNEVEEWAFYRQSAAIIIHGDTLRR